MDEPIAYLLILPTLLLGVLWAASTVQKLDQEAQLRAVAYEAARAAAAAPPEAGDPPEAEEIPAKLAALAAAKGSQQLCLPRAVTTTTAAAPADSRTVYWPDSGEATIEVTLEYIRDGQGRPEAVRATVACVFPPRYGGLAGFDLDGEASSQVPVERGGQSVTVDTLAGRMTGTGG